MGAGAGRGADGSARSSTRCVPIHYAAAPEMIMQQLDDALGVVAREPNTAAAAATTQQVEAAYMDAEHGSDYRAAAAFQPPEPAEAVGFLVEQQPPPHGHTGRALELQMDSSLLPLLPPLLGQPHAEVLQQQDTDGGDEDQSSDLAAFLYY